MSRLSARMVIGLIIILSTSIQIPWQASAIPNTPEVTSPSIVDFSGVTWTAGNFGITGYSVDAPSSMDILVSISLEGAPTGDSLKLGTHSNLTLSYGYSTSLWDSFTAISFSGVKADVNNALASASFRYLSVAGEKNSTTQVKVVATENIPGVAYFAKDDHFYKVGHFMSVTGDTPTVNQKNFVLCSTTSPTSHIQSLAAIESLTAIATGSPNCSWSEANRLARLSTLKGRPGYLANITSQGENDFLKNKLQGALNIWIGGTDGGYNGSPDTGVATSLTSTPFDYMSNETLTAYSGGTEGLWHFYDGPEAGKIFWRYTGTYRCGLINNSIPSYVINHVDSQTKWLKFQEQCKTSGYNITTNAYNTSGEGESSNYQAIGYSNWASYEPNNSSTGGKGEFNILFNWNAANGYWNDLLSSEPTVVIYGYVIEYGDSTAFTGASKTLVSVGFPINVTLNPQNGSDTSIVSASIGGQISSLSTLTRSGYSFAGWFTDSSTGSAISFPYTHGQTSNFNLYAQWIRTYTITASSDVNGTISASGTTSVNSGANQSYTFSPVSGYKISNVLVDGTSQGAITSYTFSNVVADHTISVVFEKISTTTPTYVPQKSAEQIAAEAAAQKLADEKAAEQLAVQQKALADNAEADKAFKTLQEQLTTLLNTGVFPKLPTTKNPSTTSNTSKAPSSTKTATSKSEVSVPEGTVLITPNQIATLDIEKIGSGGSANIAISQLKSGQRVRVTVISKADLNTKVVDLNSTQITTVTPGPIKPSPAINPTLINIKPAPKTSKAAPNKAEISVSGVKKNQRIRVTVKSK